MSFVTVHGVHLWSFSAIPCYNSQRGRVCFKMFQCTANALCFISLGTQEPTVVESDKTTVEVTPIRTSCFHSNTQDSIQLGQCTSVGARLSVSSLDESC